MKKLNNKKVWRIEKISEHMVFSERELRAIEKKVI